MERLYKIKRGLDLNLKGTAAFELATMPASSMYAISPSDFLGVTPRLVVKEGDVVKIGTPLFVDKATEKICFVSPVSGAVKEIVRGERRKILHILISSDGKNEQVDMNVTSCGNEGDSVKDLLLKSGLFAFFHQRPYDVTASPLDTPKAIFVSAFSKMPLAADFSFVVRGNEQHFKKGISVLSKISKVYLGISPQQINTPILPNEAEVSVFDGPNPSGNVGVHINHIAPINKGEVVWTVAPQIVVMIGKLMNEGVLDFTRRIAVGGSEVKNPQYYEVIAGAPIKDILKDKFVTQQNVRIISGNPLVGSKTVS